MSMGRSPIVSPQNAGRAPMFRPPRRDRQALVGLDAGAPAPGTSVANLFRHPKLESLDRCYTHNESFGPATTVAEGASC